MFARGLALFVALGFATTLIAHDGHQHSSSRNTDSFVHYLTEIEHMAWWLPVLFVVAAVVVATKLVRRRESASL